MYLYCAGCMIIWGYLWVTQYILSGPILTANLYCICWSIDCGILIQMQYRFLINFGTLSIYIYTYILYTSVRRIFGNFNLVTDNLVSKQKWQFEAEILIWYLSRNDNLQACNIYTHDGLDLPNCYFCLVTKLSLLKICPSYLYI